MNTIPSFTPEELHARSIRARKLITWLMIFAIVMFFAGLTSAYVVSMSGGYWTVITLPTVFYWSTAFVLGGSVTVHMALNAARKGKKSAITPMLVLTLALGLGFTYSQVQGWKALATLGITLSPNKLTGIGGTYGKDFTITKDGQPLVPKDGHWYAADDEAMTRQLDAEVAEQRDRTGPYLYTLTLAHVAHLLFGLLSLVIMIIMAVKGRYTPSDHAGLWAGTIYWHFLGGLWIYLLLFLAFVH
jgi:cytochrome c oxidase subunit 3